MAAGSAPIATFEKDPVAILDYTDNWGPWLQDDQIATAVWTLPVGIASAGQVNSISTTTIWLSGGTAGTAYSIYVTVTTVGGRTDKRTILVNIIDR